MKLESFSSVVRLEWVSLEERAATPPKRVDVRADRVGQVSSHDSRKMWAAREIGDFLPSILIHITAIARRCVDVT